MCVQISVPSTQKTKHYQEVLDFDCQKGICGFIDDHIDYGM